MILELIIVLDSIIEMMLYKTHSLEVLNKQQKQKEKISLAWAKSASRLDLFIGIAVENGISLEFTTNALRNVLI